QANFGAPLEGIRAVVTEARHASLRNALIHEGSILVMVVLVGVAVIVAALDTYRRYDVVLGAILAHGVAALFAGPGIWMAYASAARVFGGLFPLTVFAYARYRTLVYVLLISGTILLTLFTF